MTLKCPEGFDSERLRERVRTVYERVAREPQSEFHFNRGLRYAAHRLNYASADLALVPRDAAARFVGVGNPHRIGPVRAGETVLDHACGSGMDVIIAAHRTGPSGRVIGIDMTPAMIDCAWHAVCMAGVDGWTTLQTAFYEALPVDDNSIDVVISNGVVNLAPDKPQVFAEIFRVLKPGGRLHLADIVVQRELADAVRSDPDAWAECLGGALLETELLEAAAAAGFSGGVITERFDCVSNSRIQYKAPPELGAGGVNFLARKPRRRLQDVSA